MFPECLDRCAGDGLIGWNSHPRCGWSGLGLFLCDPCARFIRFGWNRRDNDALDFGRDRFGRLWQHHDLLHLFLPGAEFGLPEWPHRYRGLDRCERSRRNLRSRLYFWRWGSSRRLAQRLQEFADPVRVGFRLGSLDGLRVFRATGSARQLRRTLRSFLRFLRNARNQSRDADDRRDDDEDDVLIPMHGEHGGKIVKAQKS